MYFRKIKVKTRRSFCSFQFPFHFQFINEDHTSYQVCVRESMYCHQMGVSPGLKSNRLVVVWSMVFNLTFNNISVISWAVSFIGGGKPEYPDKTTDLSQNTDKVYHIILYRTGFELTTLVVIGTDCTGRCTSNYHTITTTTALQIE